jgi:hypothetical protein
MPEESQAVHSLRLTRHAARALGAILPVQFHARQLRWLL